MINYNNLGDLICDTPSIRNIRKHYKNEKLILFVKNQKCVELMQNCPYIDNVIEMPHSRDSLYQYFLFLKNFINKDFLFSIQFTRPFLEIKRSHIPYMLNIKNRYGLLQKEYKHLYRNTFTTSIELKNNTTRTEESLKLVQKIGISIDNEKTECWIDESKVVTNKYDEYIIIQTCATMNCRMWHKKKFIELIDNILSHKKIKILLTGLPEEEIYINEIRSSSKFKDNIIVLCHLNIDSLLKYISEAKVMVTNDTGPLHFAVALKTPIISLFGISPPEYLFKQTNDNLIIFRGSKQCKDNCIVKTLDKSDCINKYKLGDSNHNCINDIEVMDVYEKAINFI